MISVDRLKHLVFYCPDSGELRWKNPSSPKIKPGDLCKSIVHGNIAVRLDGDLYLAQRIAWLYHYGYEPNVLRHANGIKTDNRIANLVETTKPVHGNRSFQRRQATDKAQWLEDFAKAHGDRYDYSAFYPDGSMNKATIICRKHGPFEQTPTMHKAGNGCPKCADELSAAKRMTGRGAMLDLFAKAHGNRYDYSLVASDSISDKVTIICRKHGPFEQLAQDHALGRGCKHCYYETISDRCRKKTEEVVAKFVEVHGDRYDYSLVEYSGNKNKVRIICEKHGVFEQMPTDHIRGMGCRQCGIDAAADERMLDDDEFIEKAAALNGGGYAYAGVVRDGRVTRLRVVCPEHGEFLQVASGHYQGNGCPKCVRLANPKANDEIADYVESLGFRVEREAKLLGDRRSFDIYVPEAKIAIEHNGLVWHSEKFHRKPKTHLIDKKRDAEVIGIQCIHLYEDEWRYRNDASKALIKYALGKVDRLNARDCAFEIVTSSSSEAVAFMDANHIQGAAGCKLFAVLRHEGNIVMAASFGQLRSNRFNKDKNRWELTRMASSASVRGGATKIITNLLRAMPEIRNITTYYDHRLFSGGKVYDAMGFRKVSEAGPDYCYVIGDKRMHKSLFQKSEIARRFGIDMAGKTEREAMSELGIPRIWDCGKSRYELIVE